MLRGEVMSAMPPELLSEIARRHGTPVYVYDASIVRRQLGTLRSFDRVRYAQKACPNLHMLRLLRSEGALVDCVSVGELERALLAGFAADPALHEIVFTADILTEEALARVIERSDVPVTVGRAARVTDAYAACDLVVFPSTWEGFGNPPIEATIHRRPAVVGPYPVAAELAALGFRWFPSDDTAPIRRFLAEPDEALLDQSQALARRLFSQEHVVASLARLLDEAGWSP